MPARPAGADFVAQGAIKSAGVSDTVCTVNAG